MSAATSTVPRTARPGCATPCAGLCGEAGVAEAYRHRARLAAVARGVLGDPGLAEDAVQEAYLRAWRACSSFDPAAGPSRVAWLTAITRNVARDMCRARAVRPPMPRDPQSDGPADRAGDLDAIALSTLRMSLLDALGDLSPQHRGVVLRTVVHDRSYAEVARELGLPVGTVKSRVFYALRGMRGRLHPRRTP